MALSVAAFALLSIVYITATAYLIYRDDLLGGTLVRQVSMQRAYEDRIAALRSEIDRITSRHVVTRQGIGEQVALLLDRQALLGRRQQELEVLVEAARGVGINIDGAVAQPPRTRLGRSDEEPGAALAYAPVRESSAAIITGTVIRNRTGEGEPRPQADVEPILGTVQAELDKTQQGQSETLDALAVAARAEAEKLSSALAPLGVRPDLPSEPPPAEAPRGGPFVPAGTMHFVERLSVLNQNLHEIQTLRRQANALPLRAPIRATGVSSRFGTRDDPFLHRPAFHAGLDFIAPAGTDVRSAGAGTIVSAGWSGAYGQLVEIRHAAGLTSRYGHLSAIMVAPGERIAAGARIGLVGSTGRSTGPHLHYETRRDGEPVDPAFFLAAGRAF